MYQKKFDDSILYYGHFFKRIKGDHATCLLEENYYDVLNAILCSLEDINS